MPIYEFKCKSCGKQFEELVRANGANEVKCTHCGGTDVERLISCFSIKSEGGGGGGGTGKSCGPCSKSSCAGCG